MTKTPYYLHRLAKSQGKTAEELVEAALVKGGNANAAADLLNVSHDTIYSFMSVRGWYMESCHRVVKPEGETTP